MTQIEEAGFLYEKCGLVSTDLKRMSFFSTRAERDLDQMVGDVGLQ